MADIRPYLLSRVLDALWDTHTEITELRLSRGKKITVVQAGKASHLQTTSAKNIFADDVIFTYTLNKLSGGSLYSIGESLKNGYATIKGGHRVGICGTAVMDNARIHSVKDISDLCFRVCREIKGSGRGIYREILRGKHVESALIASPPGYGKTTILRDVCRLLSEGNTSPTQFVGIADERCEIAAMSKGISGFDIGEYSFVCSGYPKDKAIQIMLRTMAPTVIVTDEIGSIEDFNAVAEAAKCGVAVIASVHARDIEDLKVRFKESLRLFESVFFIGNKCSSYEAYRRCNNDY